VVDKEIMPFVSKQPGLLDKLGKW